MANRKRYHANTIHTVMWSNGDIDLEFASENFVGPKGLKELRAAIKTEADEGFPINAPDREFSRGVAILHITPKQSTS